MAETKVSMVQVGITNRCNSKCYFCFREELKRAGRKEGIVDLPKEAIQKIIDQGVRNIQLCGNRGEAIFHPDIEEIIDMIKSSGSRFEMNTNGGRFNSRWWYNLGKRMETGDQVIFALDGLKTTHEYYRDTSWMQVMENMKAYIAGGGKAIWQMVLFKHNEDQVKFIKAISQAIGCSETWIINSRFYNNKYKKPTKVYNKTKEDILIEKSGQQKEIKCRFYMGKRVYIGVDGSVWPCCFTRCHFGFKERAYPGNPVTAVFKEQEEFNNVMNTSLDKIVNESKMFKSVFDNMYNDTCGFAYDEKHEGSFEVDIDKPILYKNPNKECLVRHPRYQINFCCQLYCNTEVDQGNRRKIRN
jgi:MoaA/NifB/PqqE/SkfB family radical SAM enzyme